jgi:hypothetical protein
MRTDADGSTDRGEDRRVNCYFIDPLSLLLGPVVGPEDDVPVPFFTQIGARGDSERIAIFINDDEGAGRVEPDSFHAG